MIGPESAEKVIDIKKKHGDAAVREGDDKEIFINFNCMGSITKNIDYCHGCEFGVYRLAPHYLQVHYNNKAEPSFKPICPV